MILLLACAADGAADGAAGLDTYVRLSGSWTWRDDGGTESPEAATLLHGQYEDGITIRRGVRWKDGEDVGQIAISASDGIVVSGWSVDGEGEDGELVLAEAGATFGDVSSSGCELSHPDEIVSYYASWDNTLVSTCAASTWSFGEAAGLVRLDTADWAMELVAPW